MRLQSSWKIDCKAAKSSISLAYKAAAFPYNTHWRNKSCATDTIGNLVHLTRLKHLSFLSVEHSELNRNYVPSVCDWLYSTYGHATEGLNRFAQKFCVV